MSTELSEAIAKAADSAAFLESDLREAYQAAHDNEAITIILERMLDQCCQAATTLRRLKP